MRSHPYTLGSSEIAEMENAARNAEAKHTPTPWRFERHAAFSKYFGNIVGSYGKDELGTESIRTITVQLRYGPADEQEANAEFIIRACNAHDDLVAALKHCLREHGGFHIAGESERLARAALAKAEGHS